MGLLDDYGPLLQGVKKQMPPGSNPAERFYSPTEAPFGKGGANMPPGTNPSPPGLEPLSMNFGAGSPGFPLKRMGAPAIPLPDDPVAKLADRMPVGSPSIPMESPENGPVSGGPSTVADARNPNAYSPNPIVPPSMTTDLMPGMIKPPPRPEGIGTANALRKPPTAVAGMDFGLGDKGFGGAGDPATALGVIKPPVRPPGLGTGLLAEAPLPPVRPPNLGAGPIASAPITPPPIAPIAPPIAPPPAAAAPIGGGGGGGAAGAGGLGGIFSGLAGIAQGIGGGGAPPPPEAKAPTLQPMSPDPRDAQRKQGAQQIMSGLLGGAGLLDDPRKRRGMA